MSSIESSWINGIKEYVIHGRPTINPWLCSDNNGQGATAYYWPEIRERLWKMGTLK